MSAGHDWQKSSMDGGFTLLELLIAMTLLGLLMTMVSGSLRFGARAWERAELSSSATDEVGLAQSVLWRELELAYPHFVSGDGLQPHVDFEGTAAGVTFLAPSPAVVEAGGRARISIRRMEVNGLFGLVLLARHELAEEGAQQDSEVLLSGLRAVEFSYFGSSERDDSPVWHDRWTGQRLPDLVRIRASFEKSGRIWPDLIVAPRLSGDVSCVYDVLVSNCRGR